MKVSQLTIQEIAQQLRENPEELSEQENNHIDLLKSAAIEYVKSETGLSAEELDDHEDITFAVLALITDMYENRQYSVDKKDINRVVESILKKYAVNLIPEE